MCSPGNDPATIQQLVRIKDIRELALRLAQDNDVHVDRAEEAVRNLIALGLIEVMDFAAERLP